MCLWIYSSSYFFLESKIGKWNAESHLNFIQTEVNWSSKNKKEQIKNKTNQNIRFHNYFPIIYVEQCAWNSLMCIAKKNIRVCELRLHGIQFLFALCNTHSCTFSIKMNQTNLIINQIHFVWNHSTKLHFFVATQHAILF